MQQQVTRSQELEYLPTGDLPEQLQAIRQIRIVDIFARPVARTPRQSKRHSGARLSRKEFAERRQKRRGIIG